MNTEQNLRNISMDKGTIESAASAASAGLKAAVAGSAGAFWGGWTSNDIAMVGGLMLGLAGLLVQIHFKRREHALRLAEHNMLRAEHEARMSELN